MRSKFGRFSQHGVTLVELVVFIVIISVAIVGVLKVLTITNQASTDPMVTKQALSIAESLLSEIEQQPFTYCDPDDAKASSATSAADCTNDQNNGGGTLGTMPSTESRYSSTNPFDNVADYNGFTMPDSDCSGICIAGDSTPISGLSGYTATVTITRVGNVSPFSLAADAILKVNVQVTGPANTTVNLNGYRVRYAPTI